ncbi:MAG: hypothetical protein IT289_10235 [Oligoflexia bacterium]|nr:hypothetical protein [Oligoflexia bacterium]
MRNLLIGLSLFVTTSQVLGQTYDSCIAEKSAQYIEEKRKLHTADEVEKLLIQIGQSLSTKEKYLLSTLEWNARGVTAPEKGRQKATKRLEALQEEIFKRNGVIFYSAEDLKELGCHACKTFPNEYKETCLTRDDTFYILPNPNRVQNIYFWAGRNEVIVQSESWLQKMPRVTNGLIFYYDYKRKKMEIRDLTLTNNSSDLIPLETSAKFFAQEECQK